MLGNVASFRSVTERIFGGMKRTKIRVYERVRELRYIWTRWRKVDLRSLAGNRALLWGLAGGPPSELIQ